MPVHGSLSPCTTSGSLNFAGKYLPADNAWIAEACCAPTYRSRSVRTCCWSLATTGGGRPSVGGESGLCAGAGSGGLPTPQLDVGGRNNAHVTRLKIFRGRLP